jgi:uncharacterized protein
VCYTFRVRFEWDPSKAAANKRKHGVSFEEAMDCFRDPFALVLDEPRHPDRLILIGASKRSRVIYTVYAQRDAGSIRIISARRATRPERREYEEGEH